MAILHEQEGERRDYLFRYRLRYRRVVTCPWSDRHDLLPDKGAAMPAAYDGNTAAILVERGVTVETDDGGARTELTYELGDASGNWEIPRNHGVLTFDVGGDVEEMTFDVDGLRVRGEFEEHNSPHRYIVTKGTAFQFIPRCELVLTVAAETPLVWQLMNLYGKINKNALPNFGNASPETMRFDGVRSSRILEPGSLYLMKYRLSFEPNGWNNALKVQKQQFELRKKSEVDADNDSTGRELTMGHWRNDGDDGEDDEEDRRAYEKRDFSVLEAIVEW